MNDVYCIGGFVPVTYEMLLDLAWYRNPPMYGPPIPSDIMLRRRLGGHPAGRYRRAS